MKVPVVAAVTVPDSVPAQYLYRHLSLSEPCVVSARSDRPDGSVGVAVLTNDQGNSAMSPEATPAGQLPARLSTLAVPAAVAPTKVPAMSTPSLRNASWVSV